MAELKKNQAFCINDFFCSALGLSCKVFRTERSTNWRARLIYRDDESKMAVVKVPIEGLFG